MRNKIGFTLIELLVVIAIIAILAAILFPVFAKAREKARQVSCLSNEKQLGIAFMQYTEDYDECYPLLNAGDPDNIGWADLTWRDEIYPYVKSIAVFNCPSNPHSGDWTADFEGVTTFGPSYNANEQGVVQNPPINIARVSSPSTVINIVESTGGTQDNFNPDYSYEDSYLYAGHIGFTNYLFGDGHAKSLTPSQTTYNNGTSSYWYIDNHECYPTASCGQMLINANSTYNK